MGPSQVVGFYPTQIKAEREGREKRFARDVQRHYYVVRFFVFRSYEAQIMNKCLRHMSPRPLLFCWTKK